MNSYKIHFNTHYLLITDDANNSPNDFTKIITDEEDVFTFRMTPVELFDETYSGNILLLTQHVEDTFESILEFANTIIAAGGVVKNEAGELLLIHRRGFWDLPKGKVEKGEKIINAAKREVEEETGVAVEPITTEAFITYHAYTLKQKQCIKETHWYDMQAKSGQFKLTPQTEEDIVEAKWVKVADLKNYEKDSYPLIWAILKKYIG